ncbi:MAG: carbohydrate ABC transporter permease [Christensenellales bacterium]|jgi:raffinose/stachyose/melibiose transport system permease protein
MSNTINSQAIQLAYPKRGKPRSKALTALVFLLPALLVYGLFNFYSIIMTLFYSTQEWSGISANMTFIGLDNYIKLVNTPAVWHSLLNNFKLVIISLAVQLPFGMVLALIINSDRKSMKFLRTVYFMPMLLSTVSTGILWQLMYDPYFGLINKALHAIGLGKWAQPWLGQSNTAMVATIFVICWQYTPQYMILLRAGMTGIPEELYEAGRIDGAGTVRQFFHITLPLLAGTIRTSAVLSIVGSLKYFDLIYVMTGGGPNGATDVMATYMYKRGFVEFNMGYASTVATFMLFVSLVVIISFRTMTTQRGEGGQV